MADHSPRKRKRKDISLDQFIEGANDSKGALKSRKAIGTEEIYLTITGKGEHRSQSKRFLLYINPDLYQDLQKHCMGNMNAIINYLVRRGLNEIIKDKKLVLFDVS